MVKVKTEMLRFQADIIKKETIHYEYSLQIIQESISWIKQQEFDELDEIHQILLKEYENLEEQKKKLLLLSDALQRICDKYEKTELLIIEQGETCQKLAGYVEWVNLKGIRNRLNELGIHLID